jgi:hypothetical protein
MGKSETASASIGLKILLADLILQINETNFSLIKKMIYDGCIEDSNGYYNEVYQTIVDYPYGEDKLPEDYLQFKEYLINEFKTKGSYYKSKFSSEVEPDLNDGTLFERYLLVPVKDILETERWGYERYGVNSASRPLDFDLSVDLKAYAELKHVTVVFMVKQHSG